MEENSTKLDKYLNKYFFKQTKSARTTILVSAGFLVFLILFISVAPFRNQFQNTLYPKPQSFAQSGGKVDLVTADFPKLQELVPEQYIVVLKPGANSRAEAEKAKAEQNIQVLHTYENALQGFAFKGSAQAVQALQRNPNVKFISQDRPVQIAQAAQSLPTGIDRIDTEQNNTSKINGADERVNVNVAVLDTGIDSTHSDLNVAASKDCTGLGDVDGHGHGTHVSGTIAGIDNDQGVVGVAPGANLYAVRVLDSGGGGTWAGIICGVDWVTGTRLDADTTNDIAVANMSLGGYGWDDQNCGNTNADAFHQSICNSVSKGVVYVVAAGNSYEDASRIVPASYDEVLTVSAVADSDGKPGALGPQTNYGQDDTLATFSNFGADVDIAAPGVSIYSTFPVAKGSFTWMSGTSMAAPHVTGAAALYISNSGKATDASGSAAIRNAIKNPAGDYIVMQNDYRGFTNDRESFAEGMLYIGQKDPHDVGVVSLSANPQSLFQENVDGNPNATTVTATVGNFGLSEETLRVDLVDTTTNLSIASQSATLKSGVVTSLPLTWNTSLTTAAGEHILKATVSPVTGETYTQNNSKQIPVTVQESIHDVAVTSISAPTQVVRGQRAFVTVTWANQGTYNEYSNGVYLTDETDGTTIGPIGWGGAPGVSNSFDFPWDTTVSTSTGQHTLTGLTTVVPGEKDTANNSKSATIMVVSSDTSPSPTPIVTPTPIPTLNPTPSPIPADTTPPSTPTNLSAAAAAFNRVNLSWDPSTDNVGVTGYYVIRDGVTIAQTTSNSYSDSSVNPQSSYSYQVQAYDRAGNVSPISNTSFATTPAAPDIQPPSAPSNLQTTSVTATQVNLSWNQSTDNVGVTGYRIYRDNTQIATVQNNSYGDGTVSPQTSYSYNVFAVDASGNTSSSSNTIQVTTPAQIPQGKGILTGTVRNATTGQPIAGVSVKVTVAGTKGKNAVSYIATTNSSGVYNFTLDPASYNVAVSSSGYTSQTQTTSISSGLTTTLNFSLSVSTRRK